MSWNNSKMFEVFKEQILGVPTSGQCQSVLIEGSESRCCRLEAGHPDLHRSIEVGHPDWLWTPDDEALLFLGGPYPSADINQKIYCTDLYTGSDDDQTHYACTRPYGHAGVHGNHHGMGQGNQYDIVMWPNHKQSAADDDYADLPAALASLGTWHSDGDVWESGDAAFDIVIDPNSPAVGRKIRLNGLELPNVRKMSVRYEPGEARTVIIEILATNIREVSG